MKRLLSLLFLISVCLNGFSQVNNPYEAYFAEAYRLYPGIPAGMLEAISFTNTRFHHLESPPSCQELPEYYGVMGLVEDGKGYFQNTLGKIADLSGYSVAEIKRDPRTNILAYASAYSVLQRNKQVSRSADAQMPVLQELSEIPNDNTSHNRFALNQQYYSVLKEIESPSGNIQNRVRQVFDYNRIFGAENFKVLSAPSVRISTNREIDSNRAVLAAEGEAAPTCSASKNKTDYAEAVWAVANANNYGSRNGEQVELITIHTIQGSYASAISWFKNRNARVSAHYIVRSFDGQVTQMVCEDDKAYHVRTDNAVTIGIEHEGFIDEGLSWYTPAMYESSARLVRNIADRHGIDLRKTYGGPPTDGVKTLTNTCYLVKGHQHFRENTHIDPGPYWDWDRYYRLINGEPQPLVLTDRKGSFSDPGAEAANYGDLQRVTYLIKPANATQLVLKFKELDLEGSKETPYDYLDIYDGQNTDGKYLGRFTGNQLPADLVCETGIAFIEFRSDCRVNKAGWKIEYNSSKKNEACSSPENVVVSNLFAMGATVSWNPVSDATEYLLYVRRKNLEPKWTLYKTRSTSVTMTALGANGLYQYQLQAVCGGDSSALVGDSFITSPISRSEAPQAYIVRLNQGRFFDSGGASSVYLDQEAYLYTILPPDGGQVELRFSEFDTETGEDILTIYDGTGEGSPILGVFSGQQIPPVVRSTGNALTLKFLSDARITGKGWQASWRSIGGTNTPPVVNTGGGTPTGGTGTGTGTGGITTPAASDLVPELDFGSRNPATTAELRGAYTGSFLMSFADTDNSGRGMANRFYTLAQLTDKGWWANTDQGFFYDNFDSGLNPAWKRVTGDWSVQGGRLTQRDESATNANLYAPLEQGKEDTYVYHWVSRMEGSGNNMRSGLHFFCSEPALSNRGNSYFIWVRDAKSGDKVEIYRVANNAFDMKASKSYTFETGKAYDFKTIYNPRKGRIEVYVNNKFLLSWVDRSPLQTGTAISLRTGSSVATFDELRVYQSRSATVQVSVAPNTNSMLIQPGYLGRGTAFRALSLVVDRNIRWSEVNTAEGQLLAGNTSTPTTPSTGGERPDPVLGGGPAPGKLLAPVYSRDFVLNFDQPDAARMFYLVGNYDGQRWQANPQAGMLLEEFDGQGLSRAWAPVVGDWSNKNGVLQQSSSDATNGNIFIPLNQNSNAGYLYHFRARLLSRGSNKRFGLHFFASDGQQTNRGDSYMAWFRNHDDKSDNLELYRSADNALSRILMERTISIQPEQWVDCKMVYIPAQSLFELYVDDRLVMDWRDPQGGIRVGRFLSLRTGSSQVQFDDLRVYQLAQGNDVTVTIGSGENNLVRFKSLGSAAAIRLYSIYQDRTGRWSELRREEARVE